MNTLYCKECGRETERKSPRQNYCPECAKRKKDASKYIAKYKERSSSGVGNGSGAWSLQGKSLVDISLEARALGMTYGEYVNACGTSQMKQRLSARGISAAKARKLIREAYSEREAQKDN